MGQESAHSPSSNRGKLTSKILAVCRRPQPSCQRYRVMIESQGTTTLDPGQWQRRRSGFGRPALRSVILKTNAKVCGAGSDPVRTQRHPTHLPLRRAWHPIHGRHRCFKRLGPAGLVPGGTGSPLPSLEPDEIRVRFSHSQGIICRGKGGVFGFFFSRYLLTRRVCGSAGRSSNPGRAEPG